MENMKTLLEALALLPCLFVLAPPLHTRGPDLPPPTNPPLVSVDISKLPEDTTQLDLWLLCGQSNMVGHGMMHEEPKNDPRVVMMHLKDDQWYRARHPLHLPGAWNPGVGPGLNFAETLVAQDKNVAIGLVPCAVGGSSISRWQKGKMLYNNALRRAQLALQNTATVKGRLRGILWLQGEADAKPENLPQHADNLRAMIEAFRADLARPDLLFIACTIGEMRPEPKLSDVKAMNEILLALPASVPHTACVDARDIKTHIGDKLHFDTAAMEEIGRRYASKRVHFKKVTFFLFKSWTPASRACNVWP